MYCLKLFTVHPLADMLRPTPTKLLREDYSLLYYITVCNLVHKLSELMQRGESNIIKVLRQQ